MLRCPKCGNTYTDETLRFCLADGNDLVPVRRDDPATVRMAPAVRVTDGHEVPAKVPRGFKILLLVLAVVALIGPIAMAVFLIFVNKNSVRQSPPTPVAATASAKPSPEARARPDEPKGSAPDNGQTKDAGEVTARVDSPGDGFLALRAVPDARSGEPLAKIPHGTTVRLGHCQQEAARVDTRDGHWCMTSYDGKSGWVFDAWLDREN